MSTNPVVLCNSGPLMALGKLNRLTLLADLFSEVMIPAAVYREVVTQGLARGAPDALTIRQLHWTPGRSKFSPSPWPKTTH